MQPWKDEEVLEIGYLFRRSYWHKGYAVEAATACKQYAFETLNAKHYRGVDMPHYRYVAKNN